VWVHEDVKDDFVSAYVDWLQNHLYSNGELNPDALGKIVNQRNVERLSGYVADAVDRGGTVLLGGTPHDEVFPPTVLLDVPLDASVMSDEIFGPIMPVLTYQDRDQIVDYVRSGGKPLAMYIYSHDAATVSDLLERTSSGGVTVRGWALHYLDERLPFGGVGTSGMGRYHGVHGFRELSHARSVVVAREN
jgi:aldehyde dehydrogenase (NAD+)